MTINFDPSKTAGPAVLLDRRAAAARQDRWMLELERAGIATRSAKDKEEPRDAARQVHDALVDASNLVRNAQTDGTPPERADDMVQPLPAARTDGALAASPQLPAGGTDNAAAAQPAQGIVATDGAAAAAVSARHALSGLMVNAAGSAASPARMAATCNAAPLLAPPGARVLQRAMDGAVANDPILVRNDSFISLEVGSQSLLGVDSAETAPAIDEAPMAADVPSMPEQTDNAAFEKRLLHLYVGDDGVHAWLRDAELQGSGARAVAQALAEQVAASGKPLAGLSINGKPVIARAGSDQDAASFISSESQESWLPDAHFYPSIKKGNS